MDLTSLLCPSLPNPTPGLLPALELIAYREAVYPICRGTPSFCKTPTDWKVAVDEIGWEDWYWLLEYDRIFNNRKSNVRRYLAVPVSAACLTILFLAAGGYFPAVSSTRSRYLEIRTGHCQSCGTEQSSQRRLMFPYRRMLSV